MNKKKQRGEIALALVIAIALGSLIVGTILPKINPFHGLFGKSAANKKASFTIQKETSKPVLLKDKKGEAVAVGNEIEKYYSTGIEESTPKQTLGQRIGGFIAGLGLWGLTFIGGSLLFFGGTPIIWLWRKYAVMKQALKNTVIAIRQIDPIVYEEKLKPKLAAEHDKRDKRVIDQIKKELHK